MLSSHNYSYFIILLIMSLEMLHHLQFRWFLFSFLVTILYCSDIVWSKDLSACFFCFLPIFDREFYFPFFFCFLSIFERKFSLFVFSHSFDWEFSFFIFCFHSVIFHSSVPRLSINDFTYDSFLMANIFSDLTCWTF